MLPSRTWYLKSKWPAEKIAYNSAHLPRELSPSILWAAGREADPVKCSAVARHRLDVREQCCGGDKHVEA
jgi:hypothetical protein